VATQSIVCFRDLDAWKVSMDLAVLAYELAKLLPPSEKFELSAQVRRAAVSVPANVAEGHGTRLPRRCANHVRISLGSLAELETELELSRRLGFLTDEQAQRAWPQIDRAGQVLHGLLRAKEAQALRTTATAVGLLALPAVSLLLLSLLG
jgi:four helix bundle protein